VSAMTLLFTKYPLCATNCYWQWNFPPPWSDIQQ